jgi:hypothetical protein
MWINMVQPDRTQMIARRMPFVCWMTKATDTHTHTLWICDISTATVVSSAHRDVTLYAHYLSYYCYSLVMQPKGISSIKQNSQPKHTAVYKPKRRNSVLILPPCIKSFSQLSVRIPGSSDCR